MRTYSIAQGTLYSVLCDDLNGKEIIKRWDISIHIVDQLCCTSETNTTIKVTIFT